MRKQGGPPRQRSQSVQSSLSMTQASEMGRNTFAANYSRIAEHIARGPRKWRTANRANSLGMSWVGHTTATRKMRRGQRGGGIAANAFAAGLDRRGNRPKGRQQDGLLIF